MNQGSSFRFDCVPPHAYKKPTPSPQAPTSLPDTPSQSFLTTGIKSQNIVTIPSISSSKIRPYHYESHLIHPR